MIDTHCHIIPKFEYQDPKTVIQNALNAGVNKMICIGCDFDDIDETLKLQNEYPEIIFIALGLHPENVRKDTDVNSHFGKFKNIVLENKDNIFAIGECGLDYHYSDDPVIHEKQKDLFRKQIELSIEIDKPLVIHTRDAWDDTFALLDELNVKNKKTNKHIIKDTTPSAFGTFPREGSSARTEGDKKEFPNMDIELISGIIHSFTGGVEEAQKSIERNFKIGINGIVTFKNKNLDSLRDAVKFAGKENIVLETDSPFLSPEPYRGQVNEPARIKEIAEYVMELVMSNESEVETSPSNY